MSELIILLYRDWLEFKKKYISYILLWFSFPMILYLLMVIPLSSKISVVGLMNYKNWASPGIWICTSVILSFIYSYIKLRNLLHGGDYINKYLKAPLSNGQLLLSLLCFSVLIGIIQLIISIIVTTSLNNDNLSFLQLSISFINTTSLLIFFSILGLLLGIYIKDSFFAALVFFIIFITLSFSFGTLVPIYESHNKFLILIRNLPVYQIVSNVQLIYAGKSTMISPLIIMNILNIIMFVVVLAISYKNFRK